MTSLIKFNYFNEKKHNSFAGGHTAVVDGNNVYILLNASSRSSVKLASPQTTHPSITE